MFTTPAGIARGALLAGLLLTSWPAGSLQAAPASPVGAWDFVITGGRQGLAILNFKNDLTFEGYEIIVPKSQSPTVNGRGSVDETRTAPTNAVTTVSTNIAGYVPISGPWGYDAQGHIIGFYSEEVPGECTTNFVITTITNGASVYYSTNTVLTCTGLTNGVSFSGTVTPGKRFSLKLKSMMGNSSFAGVPQVNTLSNLTGSWYGLNTGGGFPNFYEFFSVAVSANIVGSVNIYNVVGSGPGYNYFGKAILSAQKKIAFALAADNDYFRATSGSFTPKSMKGNTSGWNYPPSGFFTNRSQFQVQYMPGP